MFANKSADYPEGYLNQVTLKSFYAMSGPDNALVYTPGNERIPDNWYTRAVGDPYDIPFFMSDFATLVQQHPELLSFGGNIGTVNSFTGLDIGNLTVRFSSSSSLTFPQNQNLPATHSKKKKQGGLYNAATLLQGNNLACFLFQSVAVAAPDLIRDTGVIADVVDAIAQINNAVAKALSGMGCPQLSQYDYNDTQLSKYPGYTKFESQGHY